MTFLIDGYNLLFSLGLAGRRTEPKLFERAREQLLDSVHPAPGQNAAAVTVVLDGLVPPASPPRPVPALSSTSTPDRRARPETLLPSRRARRRRSHRRAAPPRGRSGRGDRYC